MTMHVNLSPEMERYIKGKVSSGFYGNATEVIRDAIRRMQAEEEKISALRRAVALGDEQLDRGEGTEYSRDGIRHLAEQVRQSLHSDEPMDPDVLP